MGAACMLLHGVKDTEFEIYHGDTLTNDWDMLRETNPAKKPTFDVVVPENQGVTEHLVPPVPLQFLFIFFSRRASSYRVRVSMVERPRSLSWCWTQTEAPGHDPQLGQAAPTGCEGQRFVRAVRSRSRPRRKYPVGRRSELYACGAVEVLPAAPGLNRRV